MRSRRFVGSLRFVVVVLASAAGLAAAQLPEEGDPVCCLLSELSAPCSVQSLAECVDALGAPVPGEACCALGPLAETCTGAACDTGLPGPCAPGTYQCGEGAVACVSDTSPSPELCDGTDNDCNGTVDDGAALSCPSGPNASPACVGGQCTQVCDAGFADCNGNAGDGCEANLSTSTQHCGACGSPCAGACQAGVCKLANGFACTQSSQCTSGFCVDGVCCNNACSGVCQACSAAKKGSGSNGTCGAIAFGGDPDNECPTQAASTCGTTGVCSGMGSCALYPAGTTCAAASCSGGSQSNPDVCNGGGTCVDGGTTSCSPYQCSGAVCGTSCTSNTQCATNFQCSAGVCVPS